MTPSGPAAEADRLLRELETERDARRRLESLAALTPIVASTLDIREIFVRVAAIAWEAIPHDALGIQLYQTERNMVLAYVVSDRLLGEWDYPILRELDEPGLDVLVDDVWFEGSGDAVPRRRRGSSHSAKWLWPAGSPTTSRWPWPTSIWPRRRSAPPRRGPGRRSSKSVSRSWSGGRTRGRVSTGVSGESRPWMEVLKQATRVAGTDTTVLLTGESGTGKEVLARFIHRGSPRAKGPLVAVNCAALPEQLLESELFGYEKGAFFSGALTSKPGRIERLGGTRTLKADVWVIAATNRDLAAAMERNEFREDFYYRLHVFEIRLPPLRERRDDILLLADAFLTDLERTLGRRCAGLSEEAREIPLAHDWPGNIRELRNALERAAILCDGGFITGEQLPLRNERKAAPEAAPGALPEGTNLEVLEKAAIQRALAQARHNKSKAAHLLGLTRSQLYFRLEKYGLVDSES